MEGFIESIFQLSGFALPVPNNAHVCRKSKGLNIPVHTPMAKCIIDIAVDSTGVKVFGEGEWKVRKHGYDKRREWRKVHLAVDPEGGMIVGVHMSENDVHDVELLESLVDEVEGQGFKIGKCYADGTYDPKSLHSKGI